jgi:hypothetical protein
MTFDHHDHWVADVTNQTPDEPLVFVPVEYAEDGSVAGFTFGLTFIGDRPPGKFVGVIHANGEEAAEAWVHDNYDRIQAAR